MIRVGILLFIMNRIVLYSGQDGLHKSGNVPVAHESWAHYRDVHFPVCPKYLFINKIY